MPNYTYLIVGGGMTGAAAVGGIREADPRGSIGLIGAETHPPYNRPPLSKGLWKGDALESIWRKADTQGVTLHLGRTARSLDPRKHVVADDQGTSYGYTKLLLATGCTPRRLPFGRDQIIYFRTLDDYQRLRGQTGTGKRFVVIGGGFIGSEVAAALAMNQQKVVWVFPDEQAGGKVYPAELAKFLTGYYREKGVEVLTQTSVTGCEAREGKAVVKVRDGKGGERELQGDGVVAGIGVEPNVQLAQSAGLGVDNGIRVDTALRTSDPDIYAAGDVANFHNPALDGWLRVEHEDNANSMGRAAGSAMGGKPVPYDHLPFFYSDLFDLGYEAVGELDARLQTCADWKTPCREGVIYYLREGRVRGVLLWGIFGKVDAARELIAAPGPFGPDNLKGRISG